MIEWFWNWITQSVAAALNYLAQFLTNNELAPFWEFLLVVVLIMALIKFLVIPILGTGTGKSDKAKNKKGQDEE